MANLTMDLLVNGKVVQVEADTEISLLGVLREHLDLTGSKYGCAEGECGACTVVLDGKAVRSCITPAASVMSKSILTIEGLEQTGNGSETVLHPLQQAFLDQEAFQCGYCTPGMIMSALALLNTCPNPGEQDIVAGLQGNICRCGTYHRITRAVRQAADVLMSRQTMGAQNAEALQVADKVPASTEIESVGNADEVDGVVI